VGNASPLAHFSKESEEVRESQHFFHALAQVDKPQFASRPFARDIDPHQGSEAHTVYALQFRKVKHDEFASGYQPMHLLYKKTADAGNEPATAMDDALLAFTLDFNGQRDGGGLGWHWSTLDAEKWRAVWLSLLCQRNGAIGKKKIRLATPLAYLNVNNGAGCMSD
jgi:hypothetical protein